MTLPHFPRLVAALGLICGLSSCSGNPTAGTDPTVNTSTGTAAAAVSYKADVAPLLASTCAGCHDAGGQGLQDLVLFDAAGAISYDAAAKDITRIVRETRSGKMPRNRTPLTAAQLAVLTAWQQQTTPTN